MPFEHPPATPKRIAVIGAGISGLGAAHMLAGENRVTLFEAEDRLGGHARTKLAGKRGDQPVDTGFIVFNYQNYPKLTKLFAELDVPVAESNMSFGASIRGGWLEYSMRSFSSIFAQRRNVLRPGYYDMLLDIMKFNRKAVETARDPEMTLGELFEVLGLGRWFRDYYFLPISGAIWSTPVEKMTEFPAQALVRFFENHALLQATGQRQWYTVQGGSIEYVRRLEAAIRARGAEIRTAAPVASVRRGPAGVTLRARGGVEEVFDEVIFATHSDVTLGMLADATPEECAALGAIRYQPNTAVLHADESFMPERRGCWASWVYKADEETTGGDRIPLTYWMNSLQPIPKDDPLFVTLNPQREVRDDLVHDVTSFDHPVYDRAALRAQGELRALQGQNRSWFCGAYMKNGFHEDGLASAVDVVEAMRRQAAWA